VHSIQTLAFDQPDLLSNLNVLQDTELDALDFGVIGFDASTTVCRYNIFESKAAGLSSERVLGHALFTLVAPCMNNYLVAQRFDDAAVEGTELDATIDYVLTLRMRPVKVKLRLLAAPSSSLRYVLVHRAT
jgi:photoactive yellow protein